MYFQNQWILKKLIAFMQTDFSGKLKGQEEGIQLVKWNSL